MHKQRLLAVAVAGALGAPAIAAGSRHLMLEGELPEGVRRFITQLPETLTLDGDEPEAWVTITKCGSFQDAFYGDFEITKTMLAEMVRNFDARTYGQDVFLDVSHRPSDGAAGKFLKLAIEAGRLRGLVKFTPYGVDAHRNRGFCYLSAEYCENWKDNEKGDKHGALLCGAGLTIRPRLKGLDPFQLAEPDGSPPTLVHPDLQIILLQEHAMKWSELIKKLTENLKALKLAEPVVASLAAAAEKSLGAITDEAVAKTILASFEASGKQLAESIGANVVTLAINVPEIRAGLSADEVRKLLAETATENANKAKKLTEDLGAKRKILTDAIGAVAAFSDTVKKELAEAVIDLVSVDMTDEQVKKLADVQIGSGNRLAAARQLAGMGYHVEGSPRITVDSSNEVLALQAEFDKRLDRIPSDRRYKLSDGVKLSANEPFVKMALAKFDAENGHRLHEEHRRFKLLASGDTLVSDVAIPVSFERNVLRETLFQMTGLALCDVGTAQFAAVTQLPYSYRDTGAAGVSSVRTYEGGAVARAAVKQALEEMRPLPQKLAFEVTDELRYLAANGQISFDILAESSLNATRIIGEDGEQLIYNEHLNAADQYAKTDVTTEDLELQADDTKKVFILAGFPVLRPKTIKDLQGSTVGSVLYPVTVTYDSVARAAYNGIGGMANGIYYVLDHNLGEIYLVDEDGVIQTPANATAYTISYSYTTNVYKWDLDENADETDVHWDKFLYRFGTRKTVLEDRQHMASMAIMSGALRDSISQAKQFAANFKREGTDLDSSGNVGRIKDVPTWRSYAPGLSAGDRRIVMGERRTTRWRMCKAWTMGALQDQKNSDGRFIGKKEAYGDQFVIVHTPTLLKSALTSIVLYSVSARVARAAP